jgi:hypothetical protein
MNIKTDALADEPLIVYKCDDFDPNGKGDNIQWNKTDWTLMSSADEMDNPYETKFKILYSEKGIYVLGHCEDKLISTEFAENQGDIWNGDVFEVFLQTDEANPLYFEYEINPLNAELVILVPNNEGDFFGWSPWHYTGERKVNKAVYIHGGVAKPGEKINGWTIEVFFPYALFKALKNVPPKPETIWKGNFYRMDYDTGERLSWSWKPVEKTFHEYKKFGRLIFQ